MKIVLALFLLCSCQEAEQAIGNDRGVGLIVCARPHRSLQLQICRDSVGVTWVCDVHPPVECMRTSMIEEVYTPRAERAP